MSFFLLFIIALPVIFNADYLLSIWLKEVPEHSSLFVQLFLIFALSESLSNPMITAMLATGNIRNYQLVVGGIQLLNLPVSYVCLRMGAIPEVTVIVAIIISQICMWARLLMLSKATGFPVRSFLEDVYFSVLFKVVCGSLVVPLILETVKPSGFVGFLVSASVCVLWSMFVIIALGLRGDERKWLVNKIKEKFVRK